MLAPDPYYELRSKRACPEQSTETEVPLLACGDATLTSVRGDVADPYSCSWHWQVASNCLDSFSWHAAYKACSPSLWW